MGKFTRKQILQAELAAEEAWDKVEAARKKIADNADLCGECGRQKNVTPKKLRKDHMAAKIAHREAVQKFRQMREANAAS